MGLRDFGPLVGGGKAGENTWNSRLSEGLRGKGYETADFEMLFPTFQGLRKPDVTLQCKRGLVAISGKLGERKEVEAIVSAQEYQMSLSAIGRIAEVFALTYPSKVGENFILRVLGSQTHSSVSWFLPSLDIVIGKITEVTEEIGEFERDQESTVTSAIRVLRQGVLDFSGALSRLSIGNIENIFGGKDFFADILGYEQTTAQTGKILRTAAAYLFINQVLFYEILSTEIPEQFPKIDETDFQTPHLLKKKYFDRVLLKDYKPIYIFDVASNLSGGKVGNASEKIIRAIRALFPGTINHDILGKVFHNLIPLNFRKRVAAYFTNSMAGDLLARLAIDGPNETVMDPACGSGTLLVSSYKYKLQLNGGINSEALHKRFVEKELTGIDVMAFSAHLAAVNLALRAPLFDTDNVRIAISDSTGLKPGDVIYSARESFKDAFRVRKIEDFEHVDVLDKKGKVVMRGAINLGNGQGNTISLDHVDLLIMNPPFTSCDNLPAPYKEVLKQRFSSNRVHSSCIVGKVSFQAHFLLLADRFLKQGGKIACVIPFTTLTGKHFNNLTRFIISNYQIRAIVFGLGRSAFSDNTALSEILLVAEKGKPTKDHKFVIIGTKKNPTEWSQNDIDSIIKIFQECKSTGREQANDCAIVRSEFQRELDPKRKTLSNIVTNIERGANPATQRLDRLISQSKRIMLLEKQILKGDIELTQYPQMDSGKGWPYYGFSALSLSKTTDRMAKNTDVLLIEKVSKSDIVVSDIRTGNKFIVPRKATTPSLRRLSEIATMDVTDETDYVIVNKFTGLDTIYDTIYPQDKVAKLKVRLDEWSQKVDSCKTRMVLARRIDLAAAGTRHIAFVSEEPAFIMANSWGIRCKDEEIYPILSLWLNSTIMLLEILGLRSKTRGSFGQIDKVQMESFIMPDFTKLDENLKKKGEMLFAKLSKLPFPSIMEQLENNFQGQCDIDDFVLQILGLANQNDRLSLAKQLQEAAKHQLQMMLNAMSGD